MLCLHERRGGIIGERDGPLKNRARPQERCEAIYDSRRSSDQRKLAMALEGLVPNGKFSPVPYLGERANQVIFFGELGGGGEAMKHRWHRLESCFAASGASGKGNDCGDRNSKPKNFSCVGQTRRSLLRSCMLAEPVLQYAMQGNNWGWSRAMGQSFSAYDAALALERTSCLTTGPFFFHGQI